MINIFNAPIDPTQLDEFAEGREPTTDGSRHEERIFEVKKRKPQVTYNTDGRRMLDGVVENTQLTNTLWTTTISRGVANEWREEATGTKFQKTKRYLYNMTYDTQVFVRQSIRHYATPLLFVANFSLLLLFLYICGIFPFN